MSEELDRRSFLKRSGLLAAGFGVASSPLLVARSSKSTSKTAAATGAAGTTASSSTTTAATTGQSIETLRIPFIQDMQVPDPDIFYEGEGLQVTLSVYEGLIQYAAVGPGVPNVYQPVTKRIAPALASSWDVSADGLTYTFHLRPNVKFHDGTLADAESWRKSFERRLKVNQGPAYMVLDVASTSAPDPTTFVVKLKHPVDPFLDMLACPWGPKAVSPAAVAKYAVNGDVAQKWLTTHDAGTGPYTITEFVPGNHYTLEAFTGHWGPVPEVKKVSISIISDIQTQELKLKAGQLDMILKGLPIQDIAAFEKDSKYEVKKYATTSNVGLYFNQTKGRLLESQPLRQALKQAINRKTLISQAYQDAATVATQFFPGGVFPDGAVTDDPKYDPSVLSGLVKSLPSKKLDIAYSLDGGTAYRVMAELVQVELQAAGLEVTVRPMETSAVFGLNSAPDAQRPDVLMTFWGGDAMHPDSDLRIIFRTGAAPLNWFKYSVPAADTAMDLGSSSTDQAAVVKAYTESAKAVLADAPFLNIGNPNDVFIIRSGIANIIHDPQSVQTVRFADLKSA